MRQSNSTTNRLKMILSFAINGFLLLIWNYYYTGPCWNLISKNSLEENILGDLNQIENAEKEFNWRKEVKILEEVIPVLDKDQKIVRHKKLNQTLLFHRSEVIQSELNDVSTENVVTLLLENQNPTSAIKNLTNNLDISMTILNCDEIEQLEKRSGIPRLDIKSNNIEKERRGKLYFKDGSAVSVIKRFYAKNNTKIKDTNFNRALQTFYNLLRSQGWPGIPRVYGACIQADNKKNKFLEEDRLLNISSFSYIREYFDEAFPLCKENNVTDQCVSLKELRGWIKEFSHPGIIALKIMKGISITFQSLWLNGVFPFDFKIKDLLITKDFQFLFNEIDSFIFLDPDFDGFDFRRILSSTMCKKWQQCPSINRKDHQLIYKLGFGCKEIQGYCGNNKRCYGIDSMTYLCVFSKWIFTSLRTLLPPTWKHHDEFKNLLICSSHSLPDNRCDWTTVLQETDRLLTLAVKEWAGN